MLASLFFLTIIPVSVDCKAAQLYYLVVSANDTIAVTIKPAAKKITGTMQLFGSVLAKEE